MRTDWSNSPVVFGGFASNELAKRIDDAKPKVIVSASCGVEPGRIVEYKPLLDNALKVSNSEPNHCIIFQREMHEAALIDRRDIDWHDAHDKVTSVDCVEVEATDPVTFYTRRAPRVFLRGLCAQQRGILFL